MHDSIEKLKTQLHLFTPNEQIEIINNRIDILEKILKNHTLWTELMESKINEQIAIINNRINILEKIKKEQTLWTELTGSILNTVKNKLIIENEKN